jgi:hypothetical protein
MPNTIAQRSVWTSPKTRLKFIFARPAGSVGSPMAPRAAAALICLARGVFVIARVAFEPSGAYHHAFERRLAAAGLPLVKVNPRQTRRLAEAIGRHAKTDAVDAAMLARFAALLEPPVRPVVSATVDAMKKLQVARRALVRTASPPKIAAVCIARPCSSVRRLSAFARSIARSPRSTALCALSSTPIPPCRPASMSS